MYNQYPYNHPQNTYNQQPGWIEATLVLLHAVARPLHFHVQARTTELGTQIRTLFFSGRKDGS